MSDGALNGTTGPVGQAPAAGASLGAPPPAGSYVVRVGDSLSAIAARAGIPMSQLAWMNGVDPSRVLLTGTVLKLPTESAPAVSASRSAVSFVRLYGTASSQAGGTTSSAAGCPATGPHVAQDDVCTIRATPAPRHASSTFAVPPTFTASSSAAGRVKL